MKRALVSIFFVSRLSWERGGYRPACHDGLSLEDTIDHSPIFGHPAAPIRAVLRWAVFSAAMIIENWIRGFTHDDMSWGLILDVPGSFYKTT